jgi:thiol-disulfide isomerase/thioredoxin
MLKGGYCHRGDIYGIPPPIYLPLINIHKNHNTMKKVMYLLAAVTLIAFTIESANAQCGDETVKAEKTKLLALTFHSDYCGACKALKPNVMELQTKLDGEPVQWVKFDFTSADSKAKSEELASELGVADLYQENQSTGFVLLVDADTKQKIGKLTSRQSSDEMYQTLKNNL